jgi:hypothetical protein
LLEGIRRDIRIDETKLVDTFLSGTTLARIKDMVDRAGFVMEDSADVKVTLYATELATRLYIDFMIEYQCQSSSAQGRSDAKLEIRGDCWYDTSKQEYMNLQIREEKLTYTDEEGEQESKSVISVAGTGTIGHRTVHHTVKVPL